MKTLNIGEKSTKSPNLTLTTKCIATGWHIAYLNQGSRLVLGFGISASSAIQDAFASVIKESNPNPALK